MPLNEYCSSWLNFKLFYILDSSLRYLFQPSCISLSVLYSIILLEHREGNILFNVSSSIILLEYGERKISEKACIHRKAFFSSGTDIGILTGSLSTRFGTLLLPYGYLLHRAIF
ncbi:hypothetical protein SUGI_1097410 [Cryptomeria japonica]|nr:hypothetical protein SUGI_1097410 [Cryptomeria japonica]